MKWRECSERRRSTWHRGPSEHYYTARKGGKQYEVRASWDNWPRKSGPYSWWSFDGIGENRQWPTKEEAMKWCEQDAGVKP